MWEQRGLSSEQRTVKLLGCMYQVDALCELGSVYTVVIGTWFLCSHNRYGNAKYVDERQRHRYMVRIIAYICRYT